MNLIIYIYTHTHTHTRTHALESQKIIWTALLIKFKQ